ncbi:MAG TPA: hypothetical protein VM553_06705 [Dongiaceae bacterium]|nr:hypothetical protein [Dongiaceae bacterium]
MHNLLKHPAQYALEVWEGRTEGTDPQLVRYLAAKAFVALLLLGLATFMTFDW